MLVFNQFAEFFAIEGIFAMQYIYIITEEDITKTTRGNVSTVRNAILKVTKRTVYK